jgi:hypothetical protein
MTQPSQILIAGGQGPFILTTAAHRPWCSSWTAGPYHQDGKASLVKSAYDLRREAA